MRGARVSSGVGNTLGSNTGEVWTPEALCTSVPLREDIVEHRLMFLGKLAPQGRKLLKHIFGSPVVTATDVGKVLEVTHATANGLIADFVQQGILREVTGGKRNRLFVFLEYLDLFMKGKD